VSCGLELSSGAERSQHMKRSKFHPKKLTTAKYGALAPVVFFAAAILLDASAAWAQLGQNPWKSSEQKWGIMDRCKRQGMKAFPDYTAESLRKRDHAVDQCLAANNLPPAAPLAPRSPEGDASRR
jgi:hypothetical protein